MLPASAGQVSSSVPSSLPGLAAIIRKAHAGVVKAFSDAANCAIEAGLRLKTARECTGHGRWTSFVVQDCGLNERTARRYIQLADLAAKRSSTTDLAGVSIERAIKLLSPPKPPKSATTPKPPAPVSRRKASASARTGHVDIIRVWTAAPPAERAKAIDSIGLDAILAALPAAWMPRLEQHLAQRRQSPTPPLVVGNDLDGIPDFLRRKAPAEAAAT